MDSCSYEFVDFYYCRVDKMYFMDVAKAMALGGKIIHADKGDYSSYINLGLRCPVCGEPVHLRSGNYRQPYFAHFKGTDPRQVEECKLRVSAYGNSTQGIWSDLYEGKGQRLEIFQQHFLKMIVSNDFYFYDKVQIVKNKFSSYRLENITTVCAKYFIENEQALKKEYCTLNKEGISKTSMLQKQISFEAIDYLCVKSSRSFLEELIHYSLFNFDMIKNHDICYKLVEVIFNIPWIKVFSQMNSSDKWKQHNTFTKLSNQYIEEVDISKFKIITKINRSRNSIVPSILTVNISNKNCFAAVLRNSKGDIYLLQSVPRELTGSVREIEDYLKVKGMRPVAKLDCVDNALGVRSLKGITVNPAVVSKVAKMISNTPLSTLSRGYLSKEQLEVIVMDIRKRKSN